jgi:hypothetical protein
MSEIAITLDDETSAQLPWLAERSGSTPAAWVADQVRDTHRRIQLQLEGEARRRAEQAERDVIHQLEQVEGLPEGGRWEEDRIYCGHIRAGVCARCRREYRDELGGPDSLGGHDGPRQQRFGKVDRSREGWRESDHHRLYLRHALGEVTSPEYEAALTEVEEHEQHVRALVERRLDGEITRDEFLIEANKLSGGRRRELAEAWDAGQLTKDEWSAEVAKLNEADE